MIRTPAAARRASLIGMAGAALQLGYGLVALAFPYPEIVAPRWELLWAVVTVGMLGGGLGWCALDVARPRPLAAAAPDSPCSACSPGPESRSCLS